MPEVNSSLPFSSAASQKAFFSFYLLNIVLLPLLCQGLLYFLHNELAAIHFFIRLIDMNLKRVIVLYAIGWTFVQVIQLLVFNYMFHRKNQFNHLVSSDLFSFFIFSPFVMGISSIWVVVSSKRIKPILMHAILMAVSFCLAFYTNYLIVFQCFTVLFQCIIMFIVGNRKHPIPVLVGGLALLSICLIYCSKHATAHLTESTPSEVLTENQQSWNDLLNAYEEMTLMTSLPTKSKQANSHDDITHFSKTETESRFQTMIQRLRPLNSPLHSPDPKLLYNTNLRYLECISHSAKLLCRDIKAQSDTQIILQDNAALELLRDTLLQDDFLISKLVAYRVELNRIDSLLNIEIPIKEQFVFSFPDWEAHFMRAIEYEQKAIRQMLPDNPLTLRGDFCQLQAEDLSLVVYYKLLFLSADFAYMIKIQKERSALKGFVRRVGEILNTPLFEHGIQTCLFTMKREGCYVSWWLSLPIAELNDKLIIMSDSQNRLLKAQSF